MAERQSSKVVLLGEPAVGKTSLIRRFVEGSFDPAYQATIGTNILAREVSLRTATLVLQIWDIAGHLPLMNVQSAHFRGASGALVVVDVTRPQTLPRAAAWVHRFQKEAGDAPLVLVGNKMDLKRRIAEPEMMRVAQDWPVTFTSARDGQGVERAFEILGKLIHGEPLVEAVSSGGSAYLDDPDGHMIERSLQEADVALAFTPTHPSQHRQSAGSVRWIWVSEQGFSPHHFLEQGAAQVERFLSSNPGSVVAICGVEDLALELDSRDLRRALKRIADATRHGRGELLISGSSDDLEPDLVDWLKRRFAAAN